MLTLTSTRGEIKIEVKNSNTTEIVWGLYEIFKHTTENFTKEQKDDLIAFYKKQIYGEGKLQKKPM